jgi:hypothetical protein
MSNTPPVLPEAIEKSVVGPFNPSVAVIVATLPVASSGTGKGPAAFTVGPS